MSRMFDPILLDSHDLYHARYGRGAIILAVRRNADGTAESKQHSLDRYVAKLFNARDSRDHDSAPKFDPVLSLKEEERIVRVTVQFEHRNSRDPSYNLLTATIERVIPKEQLTLEIIRESKHI